LADHVTWYKDEATWRRFKDLCEDKDQFGTSYQDWVTNAQRKLDELARQGINLIKIESDPEQFSAWCTKRLSNEWEIPRSLHC